MRLVGIAVLTVAAATITVTGVTSADLINDGRSPVASRIGTFVPLDQTPVIRDLVSGSSVTTSPTPGPTPSPGEPDVVAPREVECSADGCAVEVRSPTITQTTTQER